MVRAICKGARLRAAGACVLAAALIAAGCGSSDDEGGATTQAAATSTKLVCAADMRVPGAPEQAAISLAGVGNDAITKAASAAVDRGYAEQSGLRLTVNHYATSQAAVAQVLNGKDQVGFLDPLATLQGIASGSLKGLRLICGSTVLTPDSQLIFAPASGGVESAADLKGKKIAVPAVNAAARIMIGEALAAEGVDLNDVTLTQLPIGAATFTALKRGDVAAAWVPAPFVPMASADRELKELIDLGEVPALEGLLFAFYAATDRFLEENPNTVAAFNKAIAQGTQYVDENRDTYVSELFQRARMPAELADRVPFEQERAAVTRAQLDRTVELLRRWGFVRGEIDLDEFLSAYAIDGQ